MLDTLPTCNLSVPTDADKDETRCAIRQVLLETLSHLGWYDSPLLTIEPFPLGLTNQLYFCTLIEDCVDPEDQKVVVRVYGKGTEDMIDRNQEIATMIQANVKNVKGKFDNGIIAQFFEGESLRSGDLPKSKYRSIIAKQMGQLHKKTLRTANGDLYSANFFDKMNQWISIVKMNLPDFEWTICENKITIEVLEEEVTFVKNFVNSQNFVHPFCHGDLNAENCIYNASNDSVAFIDFEYARNFFRGFDVGNHFCEYAGVQKHFDFANWYPRKEEQITFIRDYCRGYYDVEEPTEEMIETTFNEAKIGAHLSHLFWGIWGLVQATCSTLVFDFNNYARIRLTEYWGHKSPTTVGYCLE